jgi:N-acetylneuraminate synthase
MNEINFAGRLIGEQHSPLVIAEIGINHGGDLNVAKRMVDAAARAGVEVVKHQTHVVEDEMSAHAKKIIPGNSKDSIYKIMSDCALSYDEENELKRYVELNGMLFISTPFSRAAANRLEKMNVKAYKIGSGECNNFPLLRHIARFGKPIILSTGMNTIESIERAVDIFKEHNVPHALLHTTNIYPTPAHLVRLGAMVELKERFPDTVVGLSDHTVDSVTSLGAVALGASILERHFTDVMEREGPDIICSMDESECKKLIIDSKNLHSALGGTKGPLLEEQSTIDFAFATVVTTKKISNGDIFTEDNIWVKRPGTGEVLAQRYDEVIGRRATRDIMEDMHIEVSDAEGLHE